jgi:phosphonate transport system substrate-binding protein
VIDEPAADLLRVTSCQAANADSAVMAIVAYLAERLGRPMAFVNHIPWEERDRQLNAGQIQIGWICGWPYVRKMRGSAPGLELLAASVMAGTRYAGQPVYFSDVVVRRDSPFETFADLRGTVWGFNEPGSQSGYNVVRYHLAQLGESWDYFGRVIRTGAHQTSLRELLAGRLEATAIDSTVLETEFEQHPDLQSELRIIYQLGPSPIPPWVVATSLPSDLRQVLRALLLNMHAHPAGQAALALGRIERFARVTDRDYDPIREMERLAGHITLPVS